MDIDNIVFSTVEPPIIERKMYKKRARRNVLLGFLVFIAALCLTIFFKSEFIFIIGILFMLVMILSAYRSDKKNLFTLIDKGKLIFGKDGITIEEKLNIFVPYNEIKFIKYEYDRPRYITRYSAAPAGTYHFKLRKKNNLLLETYVYYKSINNHENFKHFADVMNYLRKKDNYFYQNIHYTKD